MAPPRLQHEDDLQKQRLRDLRQHLIARGADLAQVLGLTLQELGDEFISLSAYVDALPEIIRTLSIPGAPDHHIVEDRMLAEPVQVLMWRMIDMMDDFFKAGKCIAGFDAGNVVVNRASKRPKLIAVSLLDKTPARMAANMQTLEQIFRGIIQRHTTDKPPPEVLNMLNHMKKRPVEMMFLIRYHPCLVPIFYRCDYYIRMYTFVHDILRNTNLQGYAHLLKNLVFPSGWDTLVRQNSILVHIYGKRTYHPNGVLNPDGSVKTFAGEEVLRFHGNCTSENGMSFSRADLAKMLYSVLDLIMVSMAESLQRQGSLKRLVELAYLFPGRVPKPEDEDS